MIPLLALAAALGSEIPHDRPGDAMPDRHWDVVHLDLAVTIDPAAHTVTGTTRHTVRPLGAPHGTIRLHQEALEIRAVRVDDQPVDGWRTGRSWIDVPMPATGDEHVVEVDYAATPQTGLHFRDPRGSADPVVEVWSQGEDIDNRHWFPSWDYPSDKFTVHTAVTVPDGLHAVANGTFQGKRATGDGWTTWTYNLDRPIVNYLVAVAAGDYRVVGEDGPVPLEYIGASVHPDGAIRRGFDRVKPQMAYFAELLDEPFPYPVYRQVMVSRFLYGGMENSTLTIMADGLLQPVPGGRTRRTEEVAAHELAHQWFGDLLTCYGWRELWLNEGFATFYTGRWMEHARGEAYYATRVDGWLRSAAHTRTPMAPRGWSAVDGRENEGVYVRGASVLHMLRVFLGDEVFDRGIRLYVDRNKDRLVESDDLRRALEDVSGTHLGWFFDQWVHGTGVPAMASAWRWSEGELVVTLTQTTEGTAFWAPVEVEIGLEDEVLTRRVWLGEGEARLVLPVQTAPAWVAVDPRGGVLAEWEHDQEPAAWIAQAERSPSPYARIVAMRELGEAEAAGDAVQALARILADDALEPALRSYAASSLGKLSTAEAAAALIDALDAEDPYLRQDVVRALGETEDAPATRAALTRVLASDPDPQCRGQAIRAMVALDEARGRTLALKALAAPDRSWQAQVHTHALDALHEAATRADLSILVDRARPRWPRGVRQAAGWAASALVDRVEDEDPAWADRARSRLSAAWIPSLDDPDQRMRETAIHLLGDVGDDRAEDALQRFAAENEVPGLSEAARDAATAIRYRGAEEEEEEPPESDLEAIQQALDELKERLERLEEWR